MVMRLSDGGGGSFRNRGVNRAPANFFERATRQAAPKPVTAPRAPAYNPAPYSAPRYQVPAPAPYIPPAPAYTPPVYQQAPVYQQPIAPAPAPSQNWGGGGIVGGNGGGFSAPAPPPAAPKPPPDTRRRINGKTIKNKEIGEIDSAFADQDAALSEALKKFIADQTLEEGRQTRDTKTALTGIGRNKTVGLTGMSEDFAARGLQNSGLFMKANADAATEYEKQKQNTRQMLADNKSKMKSQRGKFESESNSTRQSARNEALARLARRQDLVVT